MNNPLGLKICSELPSSITRGNLAKIVFDGFDGEYDFAIDERAIPYLVSKYWLTRDKIISECVTAYPSKGEYRYGVVVNMITGKIYV